MYIQHAQREVQRRNSRVPKALEAGDGRYGQQRAQLAGVTGEEDKGLLGSRFYDKTLILVYRYMERRSSIRSWSME